MTDKKDIIPARVSLAQSFYRALSRWQKTIVIVPLGTAVLLVALTVVRNRIPQSAQAHSQQVPALNGSDMEPREITFIRLPRVPGRHDRIAGDFFVGKQDTVAVELPSLLNRVSAPVVTPVPASEDTLGAGVADALELKAIILGQCPKALVNDELVTIGDTVPLAESASGEYKVVAINENSVVLMWGTVETVLQLLTEEE